MCSKCISVVSVIKCTHQCILKSINGKKSHHSIADFIRISFVYNNHILQWHKGTRYAVTSDDLVNALTPREKGNNKKLISSFGYRH